jgi:hypothetical protein
MFSANLLLLPSCLPSFINTFGASTTLLSPIFNLLLLSVAVILVLSLLNNTQPNSWIRNAFAGYGVLSLFGSLFDLFNRGDNYPRQSQCAPQPCTRPCFFPNGRVHPHPQEHPISGGTSHAHFSESSNPPQRNYHQRCSHSPLHNFHGHA